jgi:hypothetical protein
MYRRADTRARLALLNVPMASGTVQMGEIGHNRVVLRPFRRSRDIYETRHLDSQIPRRRSMTKRVLTNSAVPWPTMAMEGVHDSAGSYETSEAVDAGKSGS